MSDSPPPVPPQPTVSLDPTGRPGLLISLREFQWLTLGVWVGGIFILTLMPMLLIPRVGMALGVAGSYLLFFLVWQPIQAITQRTAGTGAGVLRMVIFVAAAATIAFYLREALLGMAR
jgi:hypothetical protein